MGGADHPQVELHGRLAAQGSHFLFFQDPQQSGLQRERHVPDLIEEQRAARGLSDPATHAFAARAREGSGRVTEQLALDE